jgi:DeoR/GlpR family transcriptional regulator of sugar metabolism
MDSQEAFAQVKQSMLRSAKEIYLVVDNSKFEKGAFCKVGDFGILSGIITDREPAEEWLEFFKEQGIRCYYPN